jgi:hypothetical protein
MRLGEPLKGLQVPAEVVCQIVSALRADITEDYWTLKKTDWLMEEQQVKMAIAALENAEAGDRALSAEKIFELANRAYSLYVSQESTEKTKLLRILVSNCSVGDVNTTFDWRKPFDTIFQRTQNEEWSGRRDSNSRPSAPKADALPGCATPRLHQVYPRTSPLHTLNAAPTPLAASSPDAPLPNPAAASAISSARPTPGIPPQ